MSDDMIAATGLVKQYGEVVALDGLDLRVPAGTVLALLGPNGAGKTTAVRILTTLLRPDRGEARVAGADVRREPEQVRRRIGLSGQSAAVDEYLSGFENLVMVGRLYGMTKAQARRRAEDLLGRFDLVEAGRRPAKTYSGGMRRRLDLAAALVAEPAVVVLDEPTTGLDPRSRLTMWEVIRELVADGATLLLTTQYLEEADRLADDIVVIDRGRVIAQGSADHLKTLVGGARVEVTVADAADRDAAWRALALLSGDVREGSTERELSAPAPDGARSLSLVLDRLANEHVTVLDVGLRRPTLDDVFLTLTGHAAQEEPSSDETARAQADGVAHDPSGRDASHLAHDDLLFAPPAAQDGGGVLGGAVVSPRPSPEERPVAHDATSDPAADGTARRPAHARGARP